MPDPSEILELHMRGTAEMERLRQLARECDAKGQKAKAKKARDRAFEIAKGLEALEHEVKGPKPYG